MNSDSFNKLISKNTKVLKIVWLILLIAMIFYFVLSILFNNAESSSYQNLENIFYIIGIILAIISIFIYKKFLSENFLRRYLSTQKLKFSSDDEHLNQLSDDEKKLYNLLNHLFIPHIIVWGINESILLLGFILSYLSRNFELMIPFAAVGVFLQLYMYPKTEAILESAKTWNELNA